MSTMAPAASAVADESASELTPVYKEPSAVPANEDIANLAFALWQARGCPFGSPEEDWFRAEAELKVKTSTTEE